MALSKWWRERDELSIHRPAPAGKKNEQILLDWERNPVTSLLMGVAVAVNVVLSAVFHILFRGNEISQSHENGECDFIVIAKACMECAYQTIGTIYPLNYNATFILCMKNSVFSCKFKYVIILQVHVSQEEWTKMDFVYKKAERQIRISAELQEDFQSDEEYVDANSGERIGGRGKIMGKFKKRHITRTKAYKPQGMPFAVLPAN